MGVALRPALVLAACGARVRSDNNATDCVFCDCKTDHAASECTAEPGCKATRISADITSCKTELCKTEGRRAAECMPSLSQSAVVWRAIAAGHCDQCGTASLIYSTSRASVERCQSICREAGAACAYVSHSVAHGNCSLHATCDNITSSAGNPPTDPKHTTTYAFWPAAPASCWQLGHNPRSSLNCATLCCLENKNANQSDSTLHFMLSANLAG